MKLPARLIIVGFVAAILLSVVAFRDSLAQVALSDEQLKAISTNCLSIKGTLNQLHASDALLRVNRGQIYEAMGTQLMDRFNSRLAGNGLDATGTLAVTKSYRTTLDTFRSDYQTYEHQLSMALAVDCKAEPGAFYTATEQARTSRAKVHSDIIELNQDIDDYRSAVNDFLINFLRVSAEAQQ